MKPRFLVPLIFFVMGVLCFAWLYLHASTNRWVVLAGVASLVAAYFSVLVDLYRRKIPMPSGGHIIRFEERPRRYRVIFGFMVLFGIVVLMPFLLSAIFP